MKFSNVPTCSASNSKQQRTFKAIHHLQYRENVHFLLPPLMLRFYTGCHLDQTLSKCIASFKKSKSAKMLRIGMLFISQTLPYAFWACIQNTSKSMTFVIGKMKMVSFSLFFYAFPPRCKMPFGQRHVALNIHNICKGHFGDFPGFPSFPELVGTLVIQLIRWPLNGILRVIGERSIAMNRASDFF